MSRLASAAPTAEPLSAEEIAEMRRHLAFLRTYKHVLRLKLNAAEDLLVNGQREPTDRGVCRHLLGKVDRAVIEAAVGREPLHSDAIARARMLAGAIRLTADVGVLLAYLETLAQVRSHAEAAAAFAEVVARIDFESLSAARLGRLLQVLTETFTGHERVQVLFSLLAHAEFRRAFDRAAPALPPAVGEAFAPLRAVHRHLLEGVATSETTDDGTQLTQLAAGVDQILAAPDPVLRSYAEPLRVGILELTLMGAVPPALTDRAAGVLLSSLPRDGATYTRLAIRRGAQLLARHADDRARALLDELRRAKPGLRVVERWRAALDAPRLGRVAVAAPAPEHGRLVPAFWLDAQRPVWVRTAAADRDEQLRLEAALQAELALPGVASVVEHGTASGIPYVAVTGVGRPLTLDAARRLETNGRLAVAAAAARILNALALAGIAVPDAAVERFLHAPEPTTSLILADLDGARPTEPAAAATSHAELAVTLARLLLAGTSTRLPPELRDALEHAPAPPLRTLVRLLDRTALVASDRP